MIETAKSIHDVCVSPEAISVLLSYFCLDWTVAYVCVCMCVHTHTHTHTHTIVHCGTESLYLTILVPLLSYFLSTPLCSSSDKVTPKWELRHRWNWEPASGERETGGNACQTVQALQPTSEHTGIIITFVGASGRSQAI